MPPQNRKTQVRPVSWCGALSDEARAADADFREAIRHLWAEDKDGDWFRAKAAADSEVKGEV